MPNFRRSTPTVGDVFCFGCLVLLIVLALIGFAQTLVWGSTWFARWLGS